MKDLVGFVKLSVEIHSLNKQIILEGLGLEFAVELMTNERIT